MYSPPNNGPSHGRFRKTMDSVSKGTSTGGGADPFPLRPSDELGFGTARRDLFFNNRIAMASLKSQAQQVRAQYQFLRSQAISQGQSGLADEAGAAADRGIVGSSVQLAEQEGVRAGVGADIGQAFLQRQSGLLGVNQSRLQAIAQLRMGLSDLALKRAAAQREMALGAFGSGGSNPWSY